MKMHSYGKNIEKIAVCRQFLKFSKVAHFSKISILKWYKLRPTPLPVNAISVMGNAIKSMLKIAAYLGVESKTLHIMEKT